MMVEDRKTIQSHRDLIVWQMSTDLAAAAYHLTAGFPTHERYGLISQIRRCGTSIPANFAVGYFRESPSAYAQPRRVAQGSLMEFESLVE
jgi:four helix bundle protein